MSRVMHSVGQNNHSMANSEGVAALSEDAGLPESLGLFVGDSN